MESPHKDVCVCAPLKPATGEGANNHFNQALLFVDHATSNKDCNIKPMWLEQMLQ